MHESHALLIAIRFYGASCGLAKAGCLAGMGAMICRCGLEFALVLMTKIRVLATGLMLV